MYRRVVSCVLAAAILGACSSGGGEPTAIECQVLSWADPVTVSFPLDSGPGVIEESVDVEGLLLVEFRWQNGGLAYDTIDISSGERDYISSYTRFSPSERIEPENIGEVVVDSRFEHFTTRQQFRVRCTTA